MLSGWRRRRVSAFAARRSPPSTSTSVALTAASVLRSAQKRSDFGLLLRPILVEHDPDHDHRDDRNRQRADHRQLFEDSDNGCPPANSLPMRGAPPCHTHTETPFGPQQQCGLSVRARLRHFWVNLTHGHATRCSAYGARWGGFGRQARVWASRQQRRMGGPAGCPGRSRAR